MRIRPDVLHVNDPEFIDTLYVRGRAGRREKYETSLNMLQPGSVLAAKDHDLHKRRRAVLNPYFSMANARRLEPVVHETLLNLFRRMDGWARMGVPAPMNLAFKATTRDIIQAYALGDGERCLDMDDLNAPFFNGIAPSRLSHFASHFPWIIRALEQIPPALIVKLVPKMVAFTNYMMVRSLHYKE